MSFPVFRPTRSHPSLGGDPFWSSVDRLVEDLYRGAGATAAAASFTPRLEVTEKEGEFLVSAELPGVAEKDVHVEVHGNVLTLRGEKRSERAGDREGRHWSERIYGEFRRSVELPVEVEGDKASASFKNGVLAITLPKSAAAKVRHIPVQSS